MYHFASSTGRPTREPRPGVAATPAMTSRQLDSVPTRRGDLLSCAAMDSLTGTPTPDQGAPYEPEDVRRQRVDRLQYLGLDDPSSDEAFERFARLAASLTQAPLAMVNFVSDKLQMFRGLFAPSGTPKDGIVFDMPDLDRTMPLHYGFCPHVVANRSPLALHDLLAYPRFRGNPVIDEIGVRAYIGAPLVDDTNTVIGTVCALDLQPRSEQGWKERRQDMQHLADALLSEIRVRDFLARNRQRATPAETAAQSAAPSPE
ncbi:MAG: GAF domain-containing protein [Streptosporangiales bacterium]|nr:GAF domain-containing protein [Streptosporangiales bacterium]